MCWAAVIKGKVASVLWLAEASFLSLMDVKRPLTEHPLSGFASHLIRIPNICVNVRNKELFFFQNIKL